MILLNLRNGNTRQLAEVKRKGARQASAGQVNGKWAVYHKCTPNGCDVFRYNIKSKNKIRLPSPRFSQYFPSVARDGDVYYAASGAACGASSKAAALAQGQYKADCVSRSQGHLQDLRCSGSRSQSRRLLQQIPL